MTSNGTLWKMVATLIHLPGCETNFFPLYLDNKILHSLLITHRKKCARAYCWSIVHDSVVLPVGEAVSVDTLYAPSGHQTEFIWSINSERGQKCHYTHVDWQKAVKLSSVFSSQCPGHPSLLALKDNQSVTKKSTQGSQRVQCQWRISC